jgi:ubiquinone/menaquinone biosynthesis C-methylase UbiE
MAEITGGAQLLDAKNLLEGELDLRAGMRYADLGIGSSAHFVFPGARIVGPEGKVYAVDILKAVLQAAEGQAKAQGHANVETVWTDLEVYGAAKAIANDSLDRISMINLLYQTKQDEHVINEANRMLKPGGKVLVIDWLPTGASFGPPADTRTSLDKVREMAKVVGWRELKNFSPSEYHFAVVFEK